MLIVVIYSWQITEILPKCPSFVSHFFGVKNETAIGIGILKIL